KVGDATPDEIVIYKHSDADLLLGHEGDVTAVAGKTAVVVDDFIVLVFADLPAEAVFSVADERWGIAHRLRITGMNGAHNVGWYDLFPIDAPLVDIHLEPSCVVSDILVVYAGRLHVLVGLFSWSGLQHTGRLVHAVSLGVDNH